MARTRSATNKVTAPLLTPIGSTKTTKKQSGPMQIVTPHKRVDAGLIPPHLRHLLNQTPKSKPKPKATKPLQALSEEDWTKWETRDRPLPSLPLYKVKAYQKKRPSEEMPETAAKKTRFTPPRPSSSTRKAKPPAAAHSLLTSQTPPPAMSAPVMVV